jgi:hypothetical protein
VFPVERLSNPVTTTFEVEKAAAQIAPPPDFAQTVRHWSTYLLREEADSQSMESPTSTGRRMDLCGCDISADEVCVCHLLLNFPRVWQQERWRENYFGGYGVT